MIFPNNNNHSFLRRCGCPISDFAAIGSIKMNDWRWWRASKEEDVQLAFMEDLLETRLGYYARTIVPTLD
jgi:hypothetical protein